MTFGLFLVAGLTFAVAFSLSYFTRKQWGKEPAFFASSPVVQAADQPISTEKATGKPAPATSKPQPPKSAMLDVPIFSSNSAELQFAGCEITSFHDALAVLWRE